jgi:NAD(P)-dependent dehydrogenase (short-subunit alcohol dehydrogenase family)
LITGGARIGQAIAEELARHGCYVAMTYTARRGSATSTCSRKAFRVEVIEVRAIGTTHLT